MKTLRKYKRDALNIVSGTTIYYLFAEGNETYHYCLIGLILVIWFNILTQE